MKKLTICVVLFLFASVHAFGQSSNATVSGSVLDATGAVVPGVTIRATNTATGVVTTVQSNDTGSYSFASLLPGTYSVTAERSGFQTQTYTTVQLGNASQVRLNFSLAIAAVTQTAEVTIAADALITSSSSSVGEVLAQRQVLDLPLVSNNVLDLIGVMAGVTVTQSPIFGAE